MKAAWAIAERVLPLCPQAADVAIGMGLAPCSHSLAVSVSGAAASILSLARAWVHSGREKELPGACSLTMLRGSWNQQGLESLEYYLTQIT